MPTIYVKPNPERFQPLLRDPVTRAELAKPRPGLVVRDPDTLAPLPEAGAEVPDTSFWRRRLHDGDVVRAEPLKAVNSAAKPD